MENYKRVQTGDQNLQAIQDNTQSVVAQIQNTPFANGVLLKDQALKAGKDNLINHTLGKQLTSWIVSRINANSVIWEKNSSELSNSSANDRMINLWCSADCTVSIWVS